MEKAAQEQKQLLTEVIQKLMVILGADLTLSKVRNVHGMTVSDDGTVTDMQTEPTLLLQEIIGEFVGLSGEIVKQITDLLANKQMQQKPAIDLPAAPVQPGQDPAAGMTMPTPTSIPIAAIPTATPTVDATAATTVEPTTEPSPEPPSTEPATPVMQPQLSHDPFPNTQPTPTAQSMSTQPIQP
ncbi:MAG: hypothetical protein KGJ07_00745, partial [Patescibacteria group bacterium]|nr:hypothetical protein [Patescibacteria group bacterium]